MYNLQGEKNDTHSFPSHRYTDKYEETRMHTIVASHILHKHAKLQRSTLIQSKTTLIQANSVDYHLTNPTMHWRMQPQWLQTPYLLTYLWQKTLPKIFKILHKISSGMLSLHTHTKAGLHILWHCHLLPVGIAHVDQLCLT